MKRQITLATLLLTLTAMGGEVYAEDATETYVSTKQLWTFNDLTAGTEYITNPTTLDNGLVLHPNPNTTSGSGKVMIITSCDNGANGTFSDGTEWSVTKYLDIQATQGLTKSSFSKRCTALAATTRVFRGSIAFNTSVPGTCYAIYYRKNSVDNRYFNIFCQYEDNSVDSTGHAIVSGEITEEKLHANAGGTFFIQGSATTNIYAIMFVPDTTVTVSDAGYATFTNTYDFNLALPDGLSAYAASSVNGNTVTFSPVNVLAAGKGYLLAANEGDYTLLYTDATSTYNGINYMKAVTADESVTGDATDATNYILATVNGTTGFYKSAKGTIAKGKSYLSIPNTSGAKPNSLTMDFGTITGINSLFVDKQMTGQAYNMAGQKVNGSYKGIILRDGKKYYNK